MVQLQRLAPSLRRRFQKLFGPDVDVIWVTAPELNSLPGEANQIEDILFELVLRVRTAIPFGGRVVIDWANVHFDLPSATNQGLPAGSYVMLEMTCVRQDPSQSSALLPPVPRRSVPDNWTAADFSHAESVISSLGGQICEYNEPGRALTIRAFFPSATDTSNHRQDSELAEELNRFRILLVEDEGFVRNVACEILQSEGYQVLAARTGNEALELFRHRGPVQLLLTDVVMPGMNGRDLSERLTSLCPELKTIYMSGYTEDYGLKNYIDAKSLAFLQKPFTVESLTEKVRQVLTTSQPS